MHALAPRASCHVCAGCFQALLLRLGPVRHQLAADVLCARDTNRSRLCHLPLSVHELRKLERFDGWWKLLSAREPAAFLAALNPIVGIRRRNPPSFSR